MMVGLGETWDEILAAMDDLRTAGVDLLAIGQYLRPTRAQTPVRRYWSPDEFAAMRGEALLRGFVACEAGPWVRSSYRADAMFETWRRTQRGGTKTTVESA
jgi:lipoic acid synthetase